MRLSAHRSNAHHRDAPSELRNKQGTRIEVELRPDEVAEALELGALNPSWGAAIFAILRDHHANGRQRLTR
ncbi:hypothetical protein JDBV08_00580 [Mycobacterium phage jiawei]|uniref:hypothetical protein n=1 Tax=Brevundimonas diminuta TaxID=293 RepID=UPI0019054EA6|nr:hypothetical protein [Brevundimonas diminuta]MBK1968404.1 hypothetical protein [Brevundimonas diminuta]WRQ08283.1 hypothetical protein JDBV08_00580 [Mycobacterium phage jiawei]